MGICSKLIRNSGVKPSTVDKTIKATKKAGKWTAAGLAALIAFVGTWEGLRTKAYLDPVGIATVCYGETKNVKLGDNYTKAICDAMLSDRLHEFEDGVAKCYPEIVNTPTSTRIAFISFSYNVGVGAFCRSTLLKKLKAGDLAGACNELTKWNKAGGRVLQGLSNRRAAERRLCFEQEWF